MWLVIQIETKMIVNADKKRHKHVQSNILSNNNIYMIYIFYF